MSVNELREELSRFSHLIYEFRLAMGPGGSISARLKGSDVIYVKPSGFVLSELRPQDFVGVNIHTLEVVEGEHKPSMEVVMLAYCHRAREDVNAVVHAHPAFSIALSACDVDPNMPMYPDHAVFLGDIAKIRFLLPGSEKLAEEVAKAAKDHDCILLKNHGVVTLGSSLRDAFYRLEIMEQSAKIILFSRLLGKPSVIKRKDFDAIRALPSEKYRKELAEKGLTKQSTKKNSS